MIEDILEFDSIVEFRTYMENNQALFTDKVVFKIQEGIHENKSSVELFTLALENSEDLISTSIVKSEWKNALENSLKYYTEAEEADKAIDTWEILQKLSKD